MAKDIHIVFRMINFIHSDYSKLYELTPFDRLLLITLSSHHGKKGIFPSVKCLASELNVTKRHVLHRLEHLVDKEKLLKIDKIGRRNYYDISFLDEIEKIQGEEFGNNGQDLSCTNIDGVNGKVKCSSPINNGKVKCSSSIGEVHFTIYNKGTTKKIKNSEAYLYFVQQRALDDKKMNNSGIDFFSETSGRIALRELHQKLIKEGKLKKNGVIKNEQQ